MSSPFTDAAVQKFQAHANADLAGPMEKYMKNLFPFLGIKSPVRKELSTQLFREQGLPDNWEEVVLQLWALPEREYQYLALDVVSKVKKRMTDRHIHLLEELVTTKSWWDTVDFLASHMAGTILRRHAERIGPRTSAWMESQNMWLQRTALLFQLSYKQETNQELLFTYVSTCAASKEFFIQKAIGWSLREYAKTNPEAVRDFVEKTPLASLSKREALKHLA
ncbi:DNA alkylation repair protein [Brevibacillus sp. SIMBA_040]|uniref:DNA alkylation repair protein n=1 Tax=unclassified Brevibacillus TaxID=2684853 RepID=UPI00397C7FDA